MLAQSFSEALSGAGSGGNAQESGRSAAVAAATAFAQSGGDNAVAIAFSQAIVTNGNTVAAAFSLAIAISIGDFNFRWAGAGLVCWDSRKVDMPVGNAEAPCPVVACSYR